MGTGGIYRDEVTAARDRAEQLGQSIARCRARLSPEVQQSLPDISSEIEALDRELDRIPAGDDGLVQRADLLQRLLAVLEQAVELAPEVERELAALPGVAPDPEYLKIPGPELILFGSMVAGKLAMSLSSMGNVNTWEKMDQAAEAAGALAGTLEHRSHKTALKATFRTRAGPFAVMVRGGQVEDYGGLQKDHPSQVVVATSVALGAPAVRARPEHLRHTLLLKPLRLVRDVELGNPTFDGQFILEGEPGHVRRLITAEVQEELMLIARLDPPLLEVRPGEAFIHWNHELVPAAVAAAVQVLGAIRHSTREAAHGKMAPQ